MVIVLVVIAKLSMNTDGESILNLLVNRREFDRKKLSLFSLAICIPV